MVRARSLTSLTIAVLGYLAGRDRAKIIDRVGSHGGRDPHGRPVTHPKVRPCGQPTFDRKYAVILLTSAVSFSASAGI
jgi:hypothetical protein